MTDKTPEPCDTPRTETAPANIQGNAPVSAASAQSDHGAEALNLAAIQAEVATCLADLQAAAGLGAGDVLVVGASSSEVIGERIGTATSLAVGRVIVQAVTQFCQDVGCEAVYQCCEHLNRALVTSRDLAKARGWREVSAIPVPGAGGAVAACAFQALPDACLVEQVEADAGIDIGNTLIGMHLRRVAVPVRGRLRQVGQAHVVMAKSRSPLIGGTRAVYTTAEAAFRMKAES